MKTISSHLIRFYRAGVALFSVALLFVVFLMPSTSNAVVSACSSNTVATANITVDVGAASSLNVWLQISNPVSANLEAKVGGVCELTNFTASPTATWKKFTSKMNFVAGNNTIAISSFGEAITLVNLALVDDTVAPIGDGSNVTTTTTSTSSTTTTTSTSSSSTSTTTTTKIPVSSSSSTTSTSTSTSTTSSTTSTTTTTKLPGSSTTMPSAIAPSSTTVPASSIPTSNSVVPNTNVSTTATVPAAGSVAAPVASTPLSVLGNSVNRNAISTSGNASLPFTGSSSRTVAIWSLSIMLIGLLLLGLKQKLIFTSKMR